MMKKNDLGLLFIYDTKVHIIITPFPLSEDLV